MNEFKENLIHLHHCRGASWNIYLQSSKMIQHLHPFTKIAIETCILHQPSKTPFIHDLHSQSIRIPSINMNKMNSNITIFDPEYPPMLLEKFINRHGFFIKRRS